MLIDLGVACAWIAMSAAGAAVLALLGRFGTTTLAARGEEPLEPAHEDVYPSEALPAVAELWR